MEIPKIFEEVDSLSIPSNAQFINEHLVQATFQSTFGELGQLATTSAILCTECDNQPIYRHFNDTELLSGYSRDGKLRAVLRQVPFAKNMPPSTTKTEENVVILEVMEGQKVVARKILPDTLGKATTHPNINNGLIFSPDNRYIVWTCADPAKFERKSVLGFTTKMSKYNDYGENCNNIHHTSLAVFDITNKEAKLFGSPEGQGICKSAFASNDVLVVQVMDISSPVILGINAYTNRYYSLYATRLNEEPSFKLLLPPKRVEFDAIQVDENTAKIFSLKFPEKFGGHRGPLYPEVSTLNLTDLTITDTKTSNEEISLGTNPRHFFINPTTVAFTEERAGLMIPITIDLTNFARTEIPGAREGIQSSILCDELNGAFLLINSTPTTPQRIVLLKDGQQKPLTEGFTFEGFNSSIETCGDNASVVMLIPEGCKKFVVFPHGGPHGMSSTEYNRQSMIFAKAGWATARVNYVGSTGYPIKQVRKIFGNAGTKDLQDVVECVRMCKKKFGAEKVGIWGWSHGGFLSAHMAAKFSKEINFAVIGAPVTNLVSSYFSCDIPDWSLVESGLSDDCDGYISMNPKVMTKLWDCSPLKYVDGVTVPVLLGHGNLDRRVPIGQSIEFYIALKKAGKKATFLQYDGNGHAMKQRDAFDDFLASSIMFFENPDTFSE